MGRLGTVLSLFVMFVSGTVMFMTTTNHCRSCNSLQTHFVIEIQVFVSIGVLPRSCLFFFSPTPHHAGILDLMAFSFTESLAFLSISQFMGSCKLVLPRNCLMYRFQ